ncbi:hypothetical protein [Streptomyces marincola]|uniref:hypothetical protein n=1 Tax=Streptomyces marincola TaxID=2878388 RepID=UPI001CF51328|nr:hypothetical protein [Streptomyces marincola]UCM87653.1 hypothetical protein LC193_06680 [Streptomyces marincola]
MHAIVRQLIEGTRAFGHGIAAGTAIRHSRTPGPATAAATAWTGKRQGIGRPDGAAVPVGADQHHQAGAAR